MRKRLLAVVLLVFALGLASNIAILGADQAVLHATDPSAVAHGAAAEAEHHGLTPNAPQVVQLGPLVMTNSMVVTWIVALGLVLVAQMATREVKLVPSGLQNFCEWLVESLHGFLEGILGPELNKKAFWFFGSLFIFILSTNWFGLIPGVGTIGWGTTDAKGHFHMAEPLLRGGNADLNMTLAMSLTFFVLWTVWSLQALGVGGIIKHLFVGGSGGSGAMALFMAAIFMFVGVIEVISIAFRPVSLSFRLYGNIFAGENILEAMMVLVPWLGWLLPLPFYFLELLVGLVQALVFTLLTAVFTALMAGHHDDSHGHGHGEKSHAAGPGHSHAPAGH